MAARKYQIYPRSATPPVERLPRYTTIVCMRWFARAMQCGHEATRVALALHCLTRRHHACPLAVTQAEIADMAQVHRPHVVRALRTMSHYTKDVDGTETTPLLAYDPTHDATGVSVITVYFDRKWRRFYRSSRREGERAAPPRFNEFGKDRTCIAPHAYIMRLDAGRLRSLLSKTRSKAAIQCYMTDVFNAGARQMLLAEIPDSWMPAHYRERGGAVLRALKFDGKVDGARPVTSTRTPLGKSRGGA